MRAPLRLRPATTSIPASKAVYIEVAANSGTGYATNAQQPAASHVREAGDERFHWALANPKETHAVRFGRAF